MGVAVVYIDSMGHIKADTLTELHTFAARIGLRREWFQDKPGHPHYDAITPAKRRRAVAAGARVITPREMVKIRTL